MVIDTSLIKVLRENGVSWDEIHGVLVDMDKQYKNVSLMQIMNAYKSEETKTETEEAPQEKKPRAKKSGIPPEVAEKIEQNMAAAKNMCRTCSLKPEPNRPCVWPASFCAMGHNKGVGRDPAALVAEAKELADKYKKNKNTNAVEDIPIGGKFAVMMSAKESMEAANQLSPRRMREVRQFERELASDAESMRLGNVIEEALRQTKDREKLNEMNELEQAERELNSASDSFDIDLDREINIDFDNVDGLD